MARNGWLSSKGEEKRWGAVTKQEQKKQELLVKASENSGRTTRMVRKVGQIRNMADDTLTTLGQQTEQIKGMHGEFDGMEARLDHADWIIHGVKSKSRVKRGSPPSAGAAESAKLDRASAARQAARGSRAGSDVRGASSRSVEEKTYGEDWEGKLSKMEDQQDRDLDDLSRMLVDLKGMAQQMGSTVDTQSKSLDHLEDRTDEVVSRLQTYNKTCKLAAALKMLLRKTKRKCAALLGGNTKPKNDLRYA